MPMAPKPRAETSSVPILRVGYWAMMLDITKLAIVELTRKKLLYIPQSQVGLLIQRVTKRDTSCDDAIDIRGRSAAPPATSSTTKQTQMFAARPCTSVSVPRSTSCVHAKPWALYKLKASLLVLELDDT